MFKNKIVAVTGASGGIGRGLAEMLISEGAKVAISDLALPEQTAKDIGAKPYICDAVSYTHLRAHETGRNLVCRLLL